METAELQLTQTSAFSTKESFEHVQRVATMFSKSDMIPKRYINNIGNCINAIEMATRMNANILMVMQNLDVIQGKPGWSSVFLIATTMQTLAAKVRGVFAPFALTPAAIAA